MTISFRSHRVTTRSLGALSVMALSVGVVGCSNNEYDNDPAAVNDQQIETAITAAALDGIPQDIKGQISEDLADVEVTNVRTQRSPEGILYRVTYVDATGQPGQRVYDRSGTRVQLPGQTGQQPAGDLDNLTTPPPTDQQSDQQMDRQPGQQPGQQQPSEQQSGQQQPGQQTTIPPTNVPSTRPAAEPAGTPQGQVD